MKIYAKIEDGAPLLIFPDVVNRDRKVVVYSQKDGHCSASRAYLRRLPDPQSAAEIAACRSLIHQYTKD